MNTYLVRQILPSIRIHPEVETALQTGAPIVALESAVITAGLPREPLPAASRLGVAGWHRDQPINLELARMMQRTVRDHGAIPATIAIIEGDLCIGLEDDELIALATEECAEKASITDLAAIMSKGGYAGTTVSATLAACGLAHTARSTQHSALASPILVFATGGIGGVHRNWQHLPDISADLRQIACTPVCVVSSGAKSILDLPATLEALETLGVPVIGYRTNCFPQFQCSGNKDLGLAKRVNDAREAASVCRLHWNNLQLATGILLANPVPDEFAMNSEELQNAVELAERAASSRNIIGAARTPFLLAEIARLTNSRSLDANIALLLNNARLSSQLAVELSSLRHVSADRPVS